MDRPGVTLLARLARLRGRLALRIYLVGLAQFVLVAFGLFAAAYEARREEPSVETLRVVAESIASAPDDRAAVATAVANAEKLLHTTLAVYDERHHLVAGTPRPGARAGQVTAGAGPDGPRELHEPHERVGEGGPGDGWRGRPPPGFERGFRPFREGPLGVPISLADGRVWHLSVTAPRHFPAGLRGLGTTVILVLLVVGVASWLTARSLGRPLARLSRAANAFGAGDLTARVDLVRHDELGDVAVAFDTMATRVAEALRAEKELLANVSHELRTPLQRIHIAVELAAEGDAATAREALADIAEDLAELEGIVEDVLSAAQLSLQKNQGDASGLPPLRVVRVDVAALLARSATRFRSRYAGRTLEEDLRQGALSLEADATLIHRAVDNLLDNAHKYSDDPAAPVTLAAWRDGDSVVIEVRDRGIGVGADDLARIFEPFFRADRSRARSSGGLGLGLALAKRIVVAHRGTLSLTSVPGTGTTARVVLPLATV